jgi:mannose-6-phosphate isomerase-like protein (cupin superfamily)
MNELLQSTEAYWLLDDLVIVHVTGERSDGRLELLEFLMPTGDMTPLHVHKHQTQTTYVLEGEVTFWLPGRSVVCGPGECFHQPAGVPQTEEVTSDGPARVLDIQSPAGFDDFGFDRFVAALGRPAEELMLPPAGSPPDIERLVTTAARFGIEILGPPGELP